ncbi:MAG TPA: PAAR-like domain-containing protein [Pseudoxanthomonas sp.]|nr:PAAR-like domain-containing protein [Pseudoxanthomonas sp.]
MAINVFANNNEIAAKSATGRSASFPNVCHAPPPAAVAPKPPGVPTPFPNTCYAFDIHNGSRSVFIQGKEIALERKSYFRTSYGDEPATPALLQGVVSGKIKGRCYFQTWSPNVKVEGLCVDRHLDWVTHNHSNPPNQLQKQYISTRMPGEVCEKDRDAIERACDEKPNQEEDPRNPPRKRRKSFTKALDNPITIVDDQVKTIYKYKRRHGRYNSWVDDYCGGLWIKPQTRSEPKPGELPDASQQAFDEAKKEFKKFLEMDTTDFVKTILKELLEMAYERLGSWTLVEELGSLAVRSVLKNIVGGAAGTTGVGLVVTAAMGLSTIKDLIDTATEIAQKMGPEALEHLDDLRNIDKLKDLASKKLKEYVDSPDKFMADLMTLQAQRESCIRARKCMLVPFSKTKPADRAARTGKGCCPGQTGHHVIPAAMFNYENNKQHPCYSKNKHNGAPVICMEGASQNHGSHRVAHNNLVRVMRLARINRGDPISYEKAKRMGIIAIQMAGARHCSKECLEAQLDQFYKDCDDPNNLLSAHAGDSGPTAATQTAVRSGNSDKT